MWYNPIEQDIQEESDPSSFHLPVGAGALVVAAEPPQLINTTGVCQEKGRKFAAVGRNSD